MPPTISPELEPIFQDAAEQNNLDPNFLKSICWQESNCNPSTPDSTKGAQGIMQFKPDTAKEWGVDDPYDPAQAIPGAARYLSHYLGQGEQLQAQGKLNMDPASYAAMSYCGGAIRRPVRST